MSTGEYDETFLRRLQTVEEAGGGGDRDSTEDANGMITDKGDSQNVYRKVTLDLIEESDNISGDDSFEKDGSNNSTNSTIPSRSVSLEAPKVNSGLFSEIAHKFLESIPLKDYSTSTGEIIYRDSFRGSLALTWVCSMCNLSLEGGQYLCQQLLAAKVIFSSLPMTTKLSPEMAEDASQHYVFMPVRSRFYTIFQPEGQPEPSPPNSVFTSFTPCYSYSCKTGSLCYSPSCTRSSWRVFASTSSESVFLDPSQGLRRSATFTVEHHRKFYSNVTYWKDTVSEEIYNNISKVERDRQESIFFMIAGERLYVADLKYILDNLISPIEQGILKVEDPDKFIETVGGELTRIIELHTKLINKLETRQIESPVISGVGDLYLEMFEDEQELEAYVTHAPVLILGVERLQKEMLENREFEGYLNKLQKKPESRRLSMKNFLDRPRQYLTKLILHFETILKLSPSNTVDSKDMTRCLTLLSSLLAKLDEATAPAQTELVVTRLMSRLISANTDFFSALKGNTLLRFGTVKRISYSNTRDMEFYLFDKSLLVTKVISSKVPLNDTGFPSLEFIALYPFDKLLVLNEQMPKLDIVLTVRSKSLRSKGNTATLNSSPSNGNMLSRSLESSSSMESVEMFYLEEASRETKQLPLYRPESTLEPSWINSIEKAQENYFSTRPIKIARISLHDFSVNELINCIDFIYDDDNNIVKYLIGTVSGIFMTPVRHANQVVYPRKLYSIENVKQLKYVAKYQCIIVISGNKNQLGILTGSNVETKRVTDVQPTYAKDSEGASCFVYDETDDLVCFARNKTVGESSIKLERLTTGRPLPVLRKVEKYRCPEQCQSLQLFSHCILATTQHKVFKIERNNNKSSPPSAVLSNVHPIAIFPVYDTFLICCPDHCFFVDSKLKEEPKKPRMPTSTSCNSFLLNLPYIYCVSDQLIEVFHYKTGEVVACRSLLNGRIISGSTKDRTILVMTPRASDKQHLLQMDFVIPTEETTSTEKQHDISNNDHAR